MTSQKYSVATLVIIALVTTTTLLLGAFGISYYAYDRNRQLAILHHELAVNADRLATGLAAPVWNYDDTQVDKIIESSLMDNNIYGVVANASGKIHVRLRDAQWRMAVGDREFPAGGLIVEERGITFANKPIGTVKVFASQKFTEERLRKTLILIISIIIIADLTIVFSLYLLIWHIMLKPLKVIERYAVAFSAGGGEGATIEGSGFHGELDRLRASIGKMVGLLDVRYAEIQATARELRGTREKLEAIVQSSPLSILTIDPAGRILSWNKGAEIMFGWTEQEAVGRICPTVPESGLEDFGQMVARGLSGESFAGYVRHRQKKDKSLIEASIACAPLISGTGATAGIVAILEDITERKQAETELRESDARIRNVFEQASDGIYVISAENRYLDANERGLEMLGYTRDELLHMSVADVLAPYEVARLAVEPPRMMSGVPHLAEWEHVRKGGSTFPGEVSARRLNDYSYLAILRDLTERRLSEGALRKSEALLQETQQITKVGGWEYDIGKNRLTWTDGVYRIYDLSPETYDPNNIRQDIEFYAPHDRQTIEQAFYKAVHQGEPYDLELQFITAKGRHLWVRTIGKPVLEDGKIARVVGNIIDITEQKKAEEMILRLTRLYSVLSKTNEAIVRTQEPEELYRQVCRIAVEDGLFRMAWIGLVDPDTLFIKPVAVCGHEDGYLKEKRISIDEKTPEGRGPTGRAVREGGYSLCNDIENDAAMAPWRDEALKRGYRSSAAFALKAGGHIIGTLNIYASQPHAFQEEGEELRLLKALAADISYAIESMATEKKRSQAEEALHGLASELEQRVIERTAELKESQSALMNLVEDLNRKSDELSIARERAEAADRTKSAFLATMSHELRTPLNSIIGFTGILLQGLVGALNKEQNKQLKMVQDSAYHLLALINDVLDISKIEAGQVEIVAKRFDMPVLIQKTIEKFTPLTEKKGVVLTVRIAPDVGAVVSDQRRVAQILMNLLGNAVKFTEQGEVRLECAIEGGDVDGRMVIRVTDTGIGMKREDMDVIFKPFQQIDSGITRQYEGTGLGLSICKRLVEMLGGTMCVESELGKGSVFAFTLPLQKE